MAREQYIKMPFGKHRGKTVFCMPSSYLEWMIETFENDRDEVRKQLGKDAVEEHNFRETNGQHWEKKDDYYYPSECG